MNKFRETSYRDALSIKQSIQPVFQTLAIFLYEVKIILTLIEIQGLDKKVEIGKFCLKFKSSFLCLE